MTRRRLAAFVVLTAALTSALSGAVRFDRYVRSRGFAEHIAAALAGPLSARASIGGHHVPDPRTVVVRGLVLELPAAEGTQGGIVSAERVSFHWHRRAGLGDPMEIDGHGLVARLPGGLADLFPRGEGLGSLPDGLERMTARGRVILGPPDGASAIDGVEIVVSGPPGARRLEFSADVGGGAPARVTGDLRRGGVLDLGAPRMGLGPAIAVAAAASGFRLPVAAGGKLLDLSGTATVPAEPSGQWAAAVTARMRSCVVEAPGGVSLATERASLALEIKGSELSLSVQPDEAALPRLDLAGTVVDLARFRAAFRTEKGHRLTTLALVPPDGGTALLEATFLRGGGWKARLLWRSPGEATLRRLLAGMFGWTDLPPGLGGHGEIAASGTDDGVEGSLVWSLKCPAGDPPRMVSFLDMAARVGRGPAGPGMSGGDLRFATPPTPWGQGSSVSRLHLEKISLTSPGRAKAPWLLKGEIAELAYKIRGREVVVKPPVALAGSVRRKGRGLEFKELSGTGPGGWTATFRGRTFAAPGEDARTEIEGKFLLRSAPVAYLSIDLDAGLIDDDYDLSGPLRSAAGRLTRRRLSRGHFRTGAPKGTIRALELEGLELEYGLPPARGDDGAVGD